MSYKDDVMELIYKAYEYKDTGKYKIAIPFLKKAVDIASQYDDILFQMYCRFDLIDCYVFSGEMIKAFINFTWCNTQMKKGYIDDTVIYNIMWHYKYLTSDISRFVSIPKKKINKLFENMGKMFVENNTSLKPYYLLKVNAYMDGIDDGVDIKEYYRKYLAAPKDDKYEDCIACKTSYRVTYYIFLRDYERALKEAENIINGKYKCNSVPHSTFAELLLPLYSLEKYELADILQRKGIRLVNGKKQYIQEIAQHIMYLSLTNIEKGIKIFERNYPNFSDKNIDDMDKLWFNVGVFVLFSKCREKGIEKIKIKIPKESCIYSNIGYDVNKIREFFGNQATEIMNRFDERNGNNIVSDDIKEQLRICEC